MTNISTIRTLGRSCAIALLGREAKPRTIIRGLASGYRILVSPAENLGYLLGTAEPHLQRTIRQYVSRGDTVYDIGANMGYVSLSLAKQVGERGRVIAFEPVPRNVNLLRRNIEDNKLTNVELLAVAASDNSGEAVIRIAESLSTASLIWHGDNPSAVELVIKTVVIDDLVALESFLSRILSKSMLKVPRDKCCKECDVLLPMRGQYCLSSAQTRDAKQRGACFPSWATIVNQP